MRKYKKKKNKKLTRTNCRISDIKIKEKKNIEGCNIKYEDGSQRRFLADKLGNEEADQVVLNLLSKNEVLTSKKRFKKRFKKRDILISDEAKANSMIYPALSIQKCSKRHIEYINVEINDNEKEKFHKISTDERDGKGTITGNN